MIFEKPKLRLLFSRVKARNMQRDKLPQKAPSGPFRACSLWKEKPVRLRVQCAGTLVWKTLVSGSMSQDILTGTASPGDN